MSTQSESELENQLIKQLVTQGYQFITIANEESLKQNFRDQLNIHNNKELGSLLTDDEFKQILNHIEGGSIFQKAKKLRDRFLLKRKDKVVYLEFFNTKDWCKNQYQVTNQVAMIGKRKNRYDVTILINGLPLIQIELKRRGLEMKEAFNQTCRYAKDSYKGLFHYIQIFIISNGVNTKYYANSPTQNFKQTFFWTDKQNNRIANLEKFTDWFLEKCYISKIIAKYIVLNETEKYLMVLRPYQFYAVEEIIRKVDNNCGGGYIWHTTGSGKTLTSFKVSQILQSNAKVSKVVFVVDRKDLDNQTIEEFNAFEKGCVDQTEKTVSLIKHLKTKDLVITTIQKLNKAVKSPKLSKQLKHLKEEKIIFIFDECHRSQFGDKANEGMHERIVGKKAGFFKNTQLFGFTGTPILSFNANKTRTTKSIFGDCLHTYLIKDAIADDNVLGFSVEYINTFVQKEEIADQNIIAIDVKEAYEHPDRLNMIVDNILDIHHKKTDNKNFTAIFAAPNIPTLGKYYDIFKTKDHKLNIAAIFSYGVNENLEDARGVRQEQSRDMLDRIIVDYNNKYKTNYSTDDAESRSKYHSDISKRFKKNNQKGYVPDQIDILLVVNMFLTGYDSKPLNTLYVDKYFEAHNLVQAFSRTNRIFTEKKSFGNIVIYRDIKNNTDEALREFSNKDSLDTVLMKPFDDYKKDFEDAVYRLKEIAPHESDVDNMQSEKEQKMFVEAFRAVARTLSKLEMFKDFDWLDLPIEEQELEDYRSKYLDIYQRTKENIIKESIINDIDFEIELLHCDRINVDYIIRLLASLKGFAPQSTEYEENKEKILKEVDSSPTLKSKRELIDKFINKCLPNLVDRSNVEDALMSFTDKEKLLEVIKLAEQAKLDQNGLIRIIKNYEYSNKIHTNDIKPILTEKLGMVEKVNKLKKIKNAIIALVEKFKF